MRQLSTSQHPREVTAALLEVAGRALSDPRTRLDAVEVLGGRAPDHGRDSGAWVPARLAEWAQGVTFLREPGALGERITAPWYTRATNAGDCDDVAAAVCAWAAAVGFAVGALWVETGPGLAHVVAVISETWNDDALFWVIDPESGLASIHAEPWKWGQVVSPAPTFQKAMGRGRLAQWFERENACGHLGGRAP